MGRSTAKRSRRHGQGRQGVDAHPRPGDAHFRKMGIPTFDYGNNIRQMAKEAARRMPSTSPVSCPPISARCSAAASDRSAGWRSPAIPRTSGRPMPGEGAVPGGRASPPWLDDEDRRSASRDCRRGSAGWASVTVTGRPRLQRDGAAEGDRADGDRPRRLDCGSVACPNRETEAMKDGTDAVADWPLLNALLNTASGATWVSIHHGGGVGIGYSAHAGMVIVCDGTDDAARRARARADVRPGLRRHSSRGRRLRRGDHLRPRAAARPADARTVTGNASSPAGISM